jgi:predicted nucleotidyltransferase component of viral defense system
MAKDVQNIGASVRARLLTLAHARGQAFELLLTRYALERLLYRLSQSAWRDRFVLKGAMLVTAWFDDPHRATRDVDFLGFGDPSPEAIQAAFRDIVAMPMPDGLVFSVDDLRTSAIREEMEYGGVRLRTTASLAGARIVIVIDVGFGDAIEPGLEDIDLPVLLDLPAPHLRAYARETVIAEKFQAMVALGLANSRMKDFYDVWVLSQAYEFDAERLARAIAATFARRETLIPEGVPFALTSGFSGNAAKREQWAAFIRDMAVETPPFEILIAELADFLMPVARRASIIT